MRFKDWLMKEVGTSTACIAGFSRIALPMRRRVWPTDALTWPNKEKTNSKKIKKQPQVEENSY